MPLIRDYVAEHERALELGDAAVRAVAHNDLDGAARLLSEMGDELEHHWAGEENGIFQVMSAREQEYAEYVAPLVVEHRELARFLDTIDLSALDDQAALRKAMAELKEHISKEEDGLFPASLIALDGADWNTSIAAWREAHPGQSMIPD